MSFDRVQEKRSSFSRTTANELKMGAYYTDVAHCNVIGQLFDWPEEEVCVLEPSIGDASAVKAVTRPDINEGVRIFGVELNDKVCQQTRQDKHIVECLSADFTNGVNIRNNVFSFCFGNPPYMDDEDTDDGRRDRLENTFLTKVTGSYLKAGGILVWVIPYRNFIDNATLKYLMGHFEKIGVWKFWQSEYDKWHQIVYVGRKRSESHFPLADELSKERALYESAELVEELPLTFEGTSLYKSVAVEPTKSEDITLFATKVFDPMVAFSFLAGAPNLDDYKAAVSRRVTQKEYSSNEMGKPPIPLKKDSLYLMATSGSGQGLAGTLGTDAHLQRGVAEVIEETEYAPDPANPEKEIATVTTRTKVSMHIIEPSGKVTYLE